MKKRISPVLAPTAFSIASQFTGPPFSVMLESAALHRHLIEEMVHPGTEKLGKAATGKPAAQPRTRAKNKVAKQSRKKKSSK